MHPEVVWTSVFSDGPGGGNPCPVVFGWDRSADDELQAVAARFGADTVFVLRPTSGGAARLRYFVPAHEMEMCVHATIAASVLLGRRGRLPDRRATVESPLGLLGITWDAQSAVVDQFAPTFGVALGDVSPVAAALRVEQHLIAGPIRAVSTARAKLMVPLSDEAALDALKPDHQLLWQVCDLLGVTGIYAYSTNANGADVAARQFPCRAGYFEDPATGVAAGALAAHLAAGGTTPGWQTWRVAQGRAMHRLSLIVAHAHVGPSGAVDAVRVGGTAHEQAPDNRRL